MQAVETSRGTIYRWQTNYNKQGIVGLNPTSTAPKNKQKPKWSKQLEQQVLALRKKFPLWGKIKITTILNREYNAGVSVASIGRIISKLIKLNRIKAASFYFGRVKNKKHRVFNKHAKRWVTGMKAKKPGELIQIDHMTVAVGPGFSIKHFKAICPVTKITVAQAFHKASSKTAAEFLDFLRKKLHFPILSIQVDGGSEFMKHFEEACEVAKIPLFVLPPASPELNGNVERCNCTSRYEFYRFYDGELNLYSLRAALQGYMNEYNNFRPHQALQNLTPMAYYQSTNLEAA